MLFPNSSKFSTLGYWISWLSKIISKIVKSYQDYRMITMNGGSYQDYRKGSYEKKNR